MRPLENVPVPPYFALSAVLVYVGLVVDIFVGAYLDVTYRFDPQFEVMAAVFQACAFLFTAMCLYNFLGETNLVKRSLFSKANEFAPVFCFGALYFLFIVITRIYRLPRVRRRPRVEIWNRDGYAALHSTGKCFGASTTRAPCGRRMCCVARARSPGVVHLREPRNGAGPSAGGRGAAASTGDATPARRNGRRKENERTPARR